MYIPKRYGESKIDKCPFCNSTAVAQNSQGVPVCSKHKDSKLPDMKCVCGDYLDLMKGKFGAFFKCMNCGNVSFKKALEMNPSLKTEETKKQYKIISENKREITMRSDELDFI